MKKYSWILVVAAVAPLFPLACGGGTTGTTSTKGGEGGSTTTGTNTTGTTTAGSTTAGSTSSAAGTGGGPMTIAACDAPASAPSMGKCFMPTSGTSSSSASSSSASGSASSSSASSGSASSSSASSGSASSSSATGGGPDCSTFFKMPSECGKCAEAQCCTELQACKANAGCNACLTDPNVDPATCSMGMPKTLLAAISSCQDAKCAGPCTPVSCNPITNEGCDAAGGEACDHSSSGFSCFPPPNDVVQCDACDEKAGPFCEVGHTCLPDGACAAYCCDDGDCGKGKCDKTIIGNVDIGVCVVK